MGPFQLVKIEHLALTQYHRWYQVYERPLTDATFQNQLEILSEDVYIESAAGISKGKEGLRERLEIFKGWKNAHHVIKTTVTQINVHEISLQADILYQNIRPDGQRYSYNIHYSTVLETVENDLPLFKSIRLKPTGEADSRLFDDAYAENRGRSFMHYWCYCIESADGDSAKFNELLAEKFILQFSENEKADSLEKFDAWIGSIPSRIRASAHYPKNFSAKENEDGTIAVTVDFDWQGLSSDNEPMHAETHHEWLLSNNPDERFARIKNMKVSQIRPFEVMKAN